MSVQVVNKLVLATPQGVGFVITRKVRYVYGSFASAITLSSADLLRKRVHGAIAIIEIMVLFSALTPIARAQNIYSQTPVSTTVIDKATNLYQQGKLKAEQQNYRGAIADFSKAIQLKGNQEGYQLANRLIQYFGGSNQK